jgi:alkanesulfonate monooxygenase SsuD/methylene tetrahydromethanopterin reductase-like flavin-dependent oxidoreductase (luciferase family)
VTVYVLAAGGPDARSRIERDASRWGWSSSADRAAVGSVDDVAAEVSRWTEAGVDTVVLQPTGDEPDLEGFMVFAADVGRALAP